MPTPAEIQTAAHKGLRRAEALSLLHIMAGSPGYPQAGVEEFQIAAHKWMREAEVVALIRIAGGDEQPDADDYSLTAYPGLWWAAILESLADSAAATVPTYGNAELQIAAHEGLWWAEIIALLAILAGSPALPAATDADYRIAANRDDLMAYVLAGAGTGLGAGGLTHFSIFLTHDGITLQHTA